MTDHEHFEDEEGEAGAIGVGMGGSCPVCRAPVDLGQEFCLECGSPIRFTPRQRRQQRGGRPPAAATPRTPPAKGGFPWVPFLVVLAMIGGGVGFALVGGDDRSPSASKGDTTEPALPEITNSTPQTVSETQTTTVADCAEADPLAGTEPAIGDAGTDSPPVQGAGEQIPEVTDGTVLDDGSGSAFDDPAVPSMEPDAGGARTITVDEEGYLCADDATSNDPSDPNDPSPAGSEDPGSRGPTTPAPSGGGGSGDWPSGKEGWTVIVAGYDTQERARQRAADVQEDGFDDVGVLFSSDFTSLCPGFHVVYSGVFDSQSEANDHKRQLERAGDYAGSYVREISASGSRPSGCAAARTGT